MLDLTGIMFSSVMMLMVVVRALQLDRAQPWFQTLKRNEVPVTADTRSWKRRNRP
jgi:hypothetical protein